MHILQNTYLVSRSFAFVIAVQ